MKIAIALAAALLLAGCQTQVSKDELASTSFGPRPSAEWRQQVRGYLDPRIPDPRTARVTFHAEPQQFLQKETVARSRQWGWAVCVWVDENHPRGHPQTYPVVFFFRDGKIAHVNGGPDDSNVVGAQYAREQCERLGASMRP